MKNYCLLLIFIPLLNSCHFHPHGPFQIQTQGNVQDSAINEISGVIVRKQYPGIIWAHNDSGDGPNLYALDFLGNTISKLSIQGARARDWEDIAYGIYHGKPCLFIADIGNNSLRRYLMQIYIVALPDIGQLKATKTLPLASLKCIHFSYPDGPHNAEAMAVDPVGNIFIWTKKSDPVATLYGTSYETITERGRIELQKIATIDLRKFLGRLKNSKKYEITAADISPSGTKMVVRGESWGLEFAWSTQFPYIPQKATHVNIPNQRKGESISYYDEDTLVTISEKKHQAIYFLYRKSSMVKN